MLVDTSHLTFLGRAAVALGEQSGEEPAEWFLKLIRATACWREGRLVTTTVMFLEEMDPSSDDSQIAQLVGPSGHSTDWTQFLDTIDDESAHDVIDSRDLDAVGKNDCSLIGHAVVRSRETDSYIVTNDERLVSWVYEKIRRLRRSDSDALGNVLAVPSLIAGRDLVRCGALPLEAMQVCLAEEYADVHSRSLAHHKKAKKLSRIQKVSAELRLPEPTGTKIDDEDVRRYFLGLEE